MIFKFDPKPYTGFIRVFDNDNADNLESEIPPVEGEENKEAKEAKEAKSKEALFTQEKVNEIMLKERKKWQDQNRKLVSELESLKGNVNLTTKEKDDLQHRIDELNQSLLTKEELAKQEREKQEKKHKTELEKTTQEMSSWKTRYTTEKIIREITDAALENEVYSAEPIIAMLQGQTNLVEEVFEGKGTGRLVSRVKFIGEVDGKPQTLDLSVGEAVKQMKENPRYGYLFKSNAQSGVGGFQSAPTGDLVQDIKKMSQADYMKSGRKKLGLD